MDSDKTVRILIVGAGITGSVIALELRRLFSDAFIDGNGRITITLCEKARGPGGRMMTSRLPTNPECFADLGTQYIGVTDEISKKYGRFYTELEKEGLLVDMKAEIEGKNPYSANVVRDMVCPKGLSAVVKHFVRHSQANILFERHVTKITYGVDKKVVVGLASGEDLELQYDCIVITIPVPQVCQLEGNFAQAEALENLREQPAFQYSSRYALILFFPDITDIGLTFGLKYLDDDIIRYVAVDNVKRGAPAEPAAVVIHTTWQFGMDCIDQKKEDVEKLIMDRLYQLFPTLPKTPHRKIHKWRYSQLRIRKEEQKLPGYLVMSKEPLVICAGDGFSWSSLDGCLESAVQTGRVVYENIVARFPECRPLDNK